MSFANWLGKPSLTASGAAERLLTTRQIDAVYFNCSGNDWWQYDDLPQAMEAARQFISPWPTVVTYGSSMGGYAAFRYAAPLRAKRAVASCPQFSIDRNIMPLEGRWADDLAKITFRYEDRLDAAPDCEYWALYDPLLRLDSMHITEFKRYMPVTDVPVPCSGHPSLELLLAYGNVSRITLELLSGTHQAALTRAEHRAKRRETARYWAELAARLRERKHYTAMRYACEKSIELAPAPLHEQYLRRAANQCAAAGLRDEVAKYQARLAQVAAA